jgi:uncharacterized protein (TIGR02453 family)
MARRHFTPELFAFLRDLADNNDRVWFKANQDRFEITVRQPALDFITDFGERLNDISGHFVADSRTVGGSLFRIQRDTRFSKDKTPYKLNTGMHFRHEVAKDAHAPGYYVNLEPRNCYMGVGLWRPESRVAYAIRHHIDENPEDWAGAVGDKAFLEVFDLAGDSLVRPPKGFDADHPLIDDLRRKDFIGTSALKQASVTSGDFIDTFEDYCRRATPFMRFLCDAVGVAF